jgi:hypothetical protein
VCGNGVPTLSVSLPVPARIVILVRLV